MHAHSDRPVVHAASRFRSWNHPLYVVVLAVFVLSVYARTLPVAKVVFPDSGEVQLLDTDSYYHLRHTAYAVYHFPQVQRWDVGTNFPQGERSPHAGLFHVGLAALSLLFNAGQPSAATIGIVLAWAPVGLYLMSAYLLFGVTRSLLDTRYAAFVLAVFSLFPGLSFARTMLGFADHHAAELALLLASMWGLAAALRPGEASWPRRALHAFPLLIYQFTWSGAPLVIVLVGAAIVATLCADCVRDGDCRSSARAALDHGLVLAIGLFTARTVAPDLILVNRLYAPALACALALASLGAFVHCYATQVAARRHLAAVAVPLLGLLAAALTLLWLPPEYAKLVLEPKTAAVQEQAGVSAAQALSLHGLFGVLSLPAVPLWWLAARADAGSRPHLACAVVGALVSMAWLHSHDYSYLPPALIALSSALTLSRVASLRHDAEGGRTLVICLGLASLQLWPFSTGPHPFKAEPHRLLQIDAAWRDAMAWLKTSTPPPTPSVSSKVPGWPGGRYAYGASSYGVLSAWDFGNFVSALGERTPLSSHGFSRDIANWLVSPDEEASLARLCPRCLDEQAVRYVVLSAKTLAENFIVNVEESSRSVAEFTGELGLLERGGQSIPLIGYGPAYEGTIAARLYLQDGNGLGRYRLVYESPQQTWSSYERRLSTSGGARFDVTRVSLRLETPVALERAAALRNTPLQPVELDQTLRYGHNVTASVKIFEVVAGARVTGRAWPRASLTVFLGLRTAAERRLVYRQTVQAESSGSFELIIPYASEGGSGAVNAHEPMQLLMATSDRSAERTYRLQVSEAAVRAGAEVPVGDLTAGALPSRGR